MSDWVQAASLVFLVIVAIFNAGFFFSIRTFNEWRTSVDAHLKPLEGFAEWKRHMETKGADLTDRANYIHEEAKKRDQAIWDHVGVFETQVDRVFVRKDHGAGR